MTVNVAFFGAGPRAQPYLAALARRPDVKVIGVCDPDHRAAEQTAAGWGATVFTSCESMLAEARPDVLWICVDAHLQGDVILKAADMNIPFFIEPPAAMDFAGAKTYAARIETLKLVTAVGFSARYADVVKEARAYLGANPVPLALAWWMGDPGDDAPHAPERLLWVHACRFVDALRFFCGEVERVRALRAGATDKEAGLVLQLEFASGSVGVMTCATFARPEPRFELELMGDGWTLSFGEDLASLRLAERDRITIIRRLNRPVEEHVEAFLAAVSAQDPTRVATAYAEALRTLAVCQAAEVSAREGRPVDLAELTGS